jgi:hypothetical protein
MMNGTSCNKRVTRKTKQNIYKTITNTELCGLEVRYLRRKQITGNENGFLETNGKNIKEGQNPKSHDYRKY